MNSLILKISIVSGTVFGSATIYKVYEHASKGKPFHISHNDNFPQVSKLNRTSIFKDGKITSSHLLPLITYRNSRDRAKLNIDESKLETTLKPFIREHLRKVFLSKGWNFEELSGRVYYWVLGSQIEVYVVWKNNKFAVDYTDYDRLSIGF